MTTLSLSAYAKINLTLDIGPRRADGYHEIRSIMQTIALHDTLTFTATPDRPGVRLEVTGPESAGVPADETNLVHQAAVRLQKAAAALGTTSGNRSGLHIALHKRIPAQAGLGGGSSDAAATLLAVNEMLGLPFTRPHLAQIGAALGADVSFFLTGGTALAEGLGESVTPLPALTPDWPLVIVKPTTGVSTAAAYGALDDLPSRQTGDATQSWLGGVPRLHNDFEAVTFASYPEIATAYSLLSKTAENQKSFSGSAFPPLLCGSGAALFLRAASAEDAERVATQVRSAKIGSVWVTQTRGAEGIWQWTVI